MAEPTPTVYSYYSPEVRRIVETALTELNAGIRGRESIHDILKRNYEPGLDDFHLPLMAKYEAFARSEGVIGLEGFDEKYFTNGSSEALFHIISGLLPGEPLYQLDGEYQGYRSYAEATGRKIITCPDLDDLRESAPGVVILSNPASKDGNIVDPNVLTTILRRHKVILDLAHMGMTRKPLNVDLTQPGIVAVVGSLSKPFGMYYYRIGFCYTKYPLASLYGNRWFKNTLSIKLGEAVLDWAEPKTLRGFKTKYFSLQDRAVSEINQYLVHPMRGGKRVGASDVWLLARASLDISHDGRHPAYDLEPFKRGDQNYRFCLTPYYMEWADA